MISRHIFQFSIEISGSREIRRFFKHLGTSRVCASLTGTRTH